MNNWQGKYYILQKAKANKMQMNFKVIDSRKITELE
jgi:hypothetical protein